MLPYSKNSLHICSLIKMDEPLQRSTIAFIFGVFDFYLVFTFSWEEEISLKKKKRSLQVPDLPPLLLDIALLPKTTFKK